MSQTCATTGVSGKMRSASQIKLSVRLSVKVTPCRPSGPQPLGTSSQSEAPARRGTHREAIDAPPPRSPR